jgi:hypothetical protein
LLLLPLLQPMLLLALQPLLLPLQLALELALLHWLRHVVAARGLSRAKPEQRRAKDALLALRDNVYIAVRVRVCSRLRAARPPTPWWASWREPRPARQEGNQAHQAAA